VTPLILPEGVVCASNIIVLVFTAQLLHGQDVIERKDVWLGYATVHPQDLKKLKI